MGSPACILSFFVTAVVRGEVEDVWRWSDVPKLSQGKTAQEAFVASRALPKVRNGNTTPQPNDGTDGGCMDADVTGGDGEEEQEEGTDEVIPKKRKSRGRKKA